MPDNRLILPSNPEDQPNQEANNIEPTSNATPKTVEELVDRYVAIATMSLELAKEWAAREKLDASLQGGLFPPSASEEALRLVLQCIYGSVIKLTTDFFLNTRPSQITIVKGKLKK